MDENDKNIGVIGADILAAVLGPEKLAELMGVENSRTRTMIDALEFEPRIPLDPNDPNTDFYIPLITTSTDTTRDPKRGMTVGQIIDELYEAISATPNRTKIAEIPSQKGELSYTGDALTPEFDNYNENQLTIGGIMSAIDAGTYPITFTPKADYEWEDGTTGAKSVDWSIGKAEGSLDIEPDEITLNPEILSDIIVVTRAGDGEITAVSSDTDVAVVSVEDNIVTVSHVNQTSGTATITVSVAEGTNYDAPADKTCAVTAAFIPAVLNDATPAQIKIASESGQAPNLWAVGDCKAAVLNGTVGALTFSNQTYYYFILGFNHNAALEGDNTIHFQFGKTALTGGVNIGFADSYYGQTGSTAAFRMNLSSTNLGGWKGSYMRNTICPAFKDALPSDLQAVLKTVTKYTDNTGGGSNAAKNVTATADTVFLVAEYEMFGVRYNANNAEQSYQAQYQYYINGNSTIKYRHNATSTALHQYGRSPCHFSNSDFSTAAPSGNSHYGLSHYSIAFVPNFCI